MYVYMYIYICVCVCTYPPIPQAKGPPFCWFSKSLCFLHWSFCLQTLLIPTYMYLGCGPLLRHFSHHGLQFRGTCLTPFKALLDLAPSYFSNLILHSFLSWTLCFRQPALFCHTLDFPPSLGKDSGHWGEVRGIVSRTLMEHSRGWCRGWRKLGTWC